MPRSQQDIVSAKSRAGGAANIYIYNDGFIFAGKRAFVCETRRQPIVVLISLASVDIVLRANEQVLKGRVAVVAPNVVRRFTLEADGIVSVNIEPNHACYSAITRALSSPAQIIDAHCFASVIPLLHKACLGLAEPHAMREVFEVIIAETAMVLGAEVARIDSRIAGLVTRLCDQLPSDYEFEAICNITHLSAGRLSHLFTKEVGMSLRSFLAWRKTREAMVRLQTGRTITDVAYEVGFADSAHLARTFKKCIGILPSNIGSDCAVRPHHYTSHYN
jgi:AraC-like DNA-binding protein